MKKNTVFLKAAGKAAGLPALLLALGLAASVSLALALALAACNNGTLPLALVLAAGDNGTGGSVPDPDPDFYGVWKQDVTNYYHISAGELSCGNEDGTTIYWTMGINRWKAVANNGENENILAADYPSGYRLTGTCTYWNADVYEPGTASSLGNPYDRTWYLSADKQFIIRSDNNSLIAEKQ